MESVKIPHTHCKLSVLQHIFQNTAVQHTLVYHALAAENIHGQHKNIRYHQKQISISADHNIQHQERSHQKDPLRIPGRKSKNGKTDCHAEKNCPGIGFSLCFCFFLVSPHKHKRRRCRQKINSAKKSQGKRLLHIFQSPKPKHISPKGFWSQVWKNFHCQRKNHKSCILHKITDLLFFQKKDHKEIQNRMIFKSRGNSKQKSWLPHFSLKEKVKAKHNKKYCKNIILAENKLAEHAHGKYQECKLAHKGFLFAKSHFLSNTVHKLGGSKI